MQPVGLFGAPLGGKPIVVLEFCQTLWRQKI